MARAADKGITQGGGDVFFTGATRTQQQNIIGAVRPFHISFPGPVLHAALIPFGNFVLTKRRQIIGMRLAFFSGDFPHRRIVPTESG